MSGILTTYRVERFSPHPYMLNAYARDTIYEGDNRNKAERIMWWGKLLSRVLYRDSHYVMHITNTQELGWPEGYEGEGEDDYDEWAPEPRWRPSPAYYEALSNEPETRGFDYVDSLFNFPEELFSAEDYDEDGQLIVLKSYMYEDPRIGQKEDAR